MLKTRREIAAAVPESAVSDGVLAVVSLSRAFDGTARLADLGALLWMIVPRILPCDTFAIFVPDDERDEVVVHYAAGAHAHAIRGLTRESGAGIAGWVAANRAVAVN